MKHSKSCFRVDEEIHRAKDNFTNLHTHSYCRIEFNGIIQDYNLWRLASKSIQTKEKN